MCKVSFNQCEQIHILLCKDAACVSLQLPPPEPQPAAHCSFLRHCDVNSSWPQTHYLHLVSSVHTHTTSRLGPHHTELRLGFMYLADKTFDVLLDNLFDCIDILK